MSRLVLCLGCTRHVRVDDLHCPFCGDSARAAVGPLPRRVAGLGRAALVALGTSVAACGPGETPAAEPIQAEEPAPAATAPSEPVEAVPVEAVPIEAVAPTEPVEAAPTEPVEAAPSEAVAPTEPVEAAPSEPVEPTEAAEPSEPAEVAPAAPPPARRPRPRFDDQPRSVPLYGAPSARFPD